MMPSTRSTPDAREAGASAGWAKVLVAFLAIFVLYQASEVLQTIVAPESPVGPALMLAALLAAWPLGRWLGWRGYDAYGLSFVPGWLRILVAGMMLAALAKLAALAVSAPAGAGTPEGADTGLSLQFLAIAALTTFVPSVAEDILTRGFLLRTIPVRLGPAAFIVGSAALYTANHIWRFDWGITEQVRLFCLGLAYGAAAWRWRSLWGAVALHWGWNLANLLADGLFTVGDGSIDAARLTAAAVHLVLVAVILLIPLPLARQEAAT